MLPPNSSRKLFITTTTVLPSWPTTPMVSGILPSIANVTSTTTVPSEMNRFCRMTAPRALAQAEGGEKIFQPVVHQHHVGLFQRGVGTARAHRHADVRGGQARRVVHAVADHRHAFALPAQFPDGGDFLLRLQFGAHVVQLQFGAQMFGGGLAVAGQHDGCATLRAAVRQ